MAMRRDGSDGRIESKSRLGADSRDFFFVPTTACPDGWSEIQLVSLGFTAVIGWSDLLGKRLMADVPVLDTHTVRGVQKLKMEGYPSCEQRVR